MNRQPTGTLWCLRSSSMVGGGGGGVARHVWCELKQAFQRSLRESAGTPGSAQVKPSPASKTQPSCANSAP